MNDKQFFIHKNQLIFNSDVIIMFNHTEIYDNFKISRYVDKFVVTGKKIKVAYLDKDVEVTNILNGFIQFYKIEKKYNGFVRMIFNCIVKMNEYLKLRDNGIDKNIKSSKIENPPKNYNFLKKMYFRYDKTSPNLFNPFGFKLCIEEGLYAYDIDEYTEIATIPENKIDYFVNDLLIINKSDFNKYITDIHHVRID